MPDTPCVQQFLDISTTHLRPNTRNILDHDQKAAAV